MLYETWFHVVAPTNAHVFTVGGVQSTQHTATANTMHGERKTVTKAIGGTTITVVVEHIDGWLIREVHRGGVCTEHSVDALTYPTPEAAINAGIAMALLMQKPVAAG